MSKPVGFRVERSNSAENASRATDPSTEQGTSPSAPAPSQPTVSRTAPPLPKRNKGQLFLSLIFISMFVGMVYMIYSAFFQFKAYGTVQGRLIDVPSPWDGTLANWQVRDGDMVNQGDLLAVLINVDMEHRLQKLEDDLQHAQAQLDAEASKLKFDILDKSDREQKALAEFLESQGNLLAERTVLQDLEQKLARSKRLLKSKHVSQQKYDELYYRCSGQKQKVEKLESAVEVLRQRAESSNQAEAIVKSQLDPLLFNLKKIQSERERLRMRLDMGRIVAPVTGRITMRHLLTGESIDKGETLVEVLEDNSCEAVLYLPQQFAEDLKVDRRVNVVLTPFNKEIPCVVRRIENKFLAAPPNIERFYQRNQHLLPVHLEPLPEYRAEFARRVNGTVKLPYAWGEWVEDTIDATKNRFHAVINRKPNDKKAKLVPVEPEASKEEDVVREEVVTATQASVEK